MSMTGVFIQDLIFFLFQIRLYETVNLNILTLSSLIDR